MSSERQVSLPDALLRSFRRPHKPISPSTVARWLLEVMSSSGVDTSKFKAHSVRGAATSAARKNGASVSEILKVADWAQASTFNKFYHRDMAQGLPRWHRVRFCSAGCIQLSCFCVRLHGVSMRAIRMFAPPVSAKACLPVWYSPTLPLPCTVSSMLPLAS